MEIGHILKNARNDAGLTQDQAAEALFVSRQTVSNWETGKTFPDIVSVVKMSDLYSVSLDHLLKEESSVKQTYLEYLEESTNTVKSKDRQSKLILICVSVGVWALSLLAFFLVKNGTDTTGYSLAVTWAILPILFFTVSYLIGANGYFGKARWITPLVFSLMYSISGSITSIVADGVLYQSVKWPDFAKLPIGLLISLVGLVLGELVFRKKRRAGESGDKEE
ncbi:MAG: helix-turn-helix domain-containing protein [Clostridiales bacterium]|nr:helix-turn-helix domain-containing protein [Clostridiales bacterium]